MDFLLYNAVFRWPDSGLFANSESENDGYDLGVGASSSSSCFNVILMLNFFRGIPHELEEAAEIDGAGQWRICFQIFVPCAKPSIATLMLFSFISHWNSWFDGLIYSNFPSSYPLASFLQTVVVQRDMTLLSLEDWQSMSMISDRTVRCAQIFVGIIPIILIYPFAQKYFVKGMTVGSVKG